MICLGLFLFLLTGVSSWTLFLLLESSTPPHLSYITLSSDVTPLSPALSSAR